jgi:hypothetical protein
LAKTPPPAPYQEVRYGSHDDVLLLREEVAKENRNRRASRILRLRLLWQLPQDPNAAVRKPVSETSTSHRREEGMKVSVIGNSVFLEVAPNYMAFLATKQVWDTLSVKEQTERIREAQRQRHRGGWT